MSTFHLQILTPNGSFFDGEAESVSVRAVTGNLTILPRHINFVTPLGMGLSKVVVDGEAKRACCIGGLLAVTDGSVRILATSFEWKEQIDLPRAEASLQKAEQILAQADVSKETRQLAEARKKRALLRIALANE